MNEETGNDYFTCALGVSIETSQSSIQQWVTAKHALNNKRLSIHLFFHLNLCLPHSSICLCLDYLNLSTYIIEPTSLISHLFQFFLSRLFL